MSWSWPLGRWDRPRRAACSIALGCGAAVAMLGLASPVGAHHIPGATYTGAHSGGGAVVLVVTPDGSGISSFTIGAGAPAVGCFVSGSGTAFVPPLPIANHQFAGSSATMQTFFGAFDRVQQVSGQFILRAPPFTPCFNQAIRWSAVTTASPEDSEECKKARAAVRRYVRKAKRAKRKLRQAESEGRKRRLRKQVRRFKKEAQKARENADEVCKPQFKRR